jgi:catechol 2,3-dioxygenase-like lactoylglutathione lyase family enzyme
MSSYNFDHTAFQVSDMDKAIAWYKNTLGFEFLFRGTNEEEKEEYAFLKYGESRLELIQDLLTPYEKPIIKKPFCPHLCLEVESMELALKIINDHGLTIVRGPLEIKDEETWVYFADPDHNILEFIQWYHKK